MHWPRVGHDGMPSMVCHCVVGTLGARSRTTSTVGYRPPTGSWWSATSRPARRARRCMPAWWGRGLPWAPYATPTPSSRCRWLTASRNYAPRSDQGVWLGPSLPQPGGCWSTALRLFATQEVLDPSGCSALAPREPPRGLLVRWVAGASLRLGDPGHDGVDVHAASAPGGFSAAAATGGTTHMVLLWLALDYWLTVWCKPQAGHCQGTWTRVLPAST